MIFIKVYYNLHGALLKFIAQIVAQGPENHSLIAIIIITICFVFVITIITTINNTKDTSSH